MYNQLVYLQQVGLKTLGFDAGAIDGIPGPKTDAAIIAWTNSIGVSTNSLSARIVAAARSQIGIREITKNQGPGIEKYWSATSYPLGYNNREPYCAAFVCWLIKTALQNTQFSFELPTSPVAYDIEKWARANSNKGVKIYSNDCKILPGDIFTLAAASHTGIIVGVNSSTITTVEGNTDGSGSREGDGVYERTRTIVSLRKIIRIS